MYGGSSLRKVTSERLVTSHTSQRRLLFLFAQIFGVTSIRMYQKSDWLKTASE